VAAQFGVPYRVIPIAAETKAAQEAAQIALLESERHRSRRARALHADPVVGVRRALRARIINIHHSFLPAFSGGAPTSRRTSAA
jgi:formyltetrahydrofolate deformylase